MTRSTRSASSHAVVAATGVALLTITAGIGATPASAVSSSAMSSASSGGTTGSSVTTVRPATARVGDGENGLLIFVNLSRAQLCTPERIAFENALEAWFADPQGEPPEEPAASQQGVRPVTFTHRDLPGGGSRDVTDGRRLPVEVWRFDAEEGGIDCTATDGPGASRFAVGTVDWGAVQVTTATGRRSDLRLEAAVVDSTGRAYSYLVRYRFVQQGTSEGVFTSKIRLRPVR